MANIRVGFANLPQLQQAMRDKGSAIARELRGAIRRSALLIERRSKEEAPVRTGRLRGSIVTTIMAVSATVQPKVDYAVFVHEGTQFIRSNPFMLRAVESSEGEIERTFAAALNRGMVA